MKRHGNSKFKSPKEVTLRSLVNRYIQKSKLRKLAWRLSLEDTKKLLLGNCHYCGTKPKNLHNVYIAKYGKYRVNRKEWADAAWIKFNGIDRLNNNLGYSNKNCVSCCKTCNFAKHTSSYKEFKKWIKQIIAYNKGNI